MHTSRHFAYLLFLLCCILQYTYAAVSLRVFTKDESLNENNISKPRFYIQNFGTEPLSNFYCYYYFTVENNKNPIVDDYYTPDASITLENRNNGLYRVKFLFSGITINPGQTLPNPDGEIIGIRYSDWSTLDKTNDFSNTRTSSFILNGNIPVYSSAGVLIYGNEPGDPGNPPQPPVVYTDIGSYAVLSKEYTDLRDRVTITGGNVGATVYTEAGCNTVVNGSVFTGGSMFLRERAQINGDAIAAEAVNKQNYVVVTGATRAHAQVQIPQAAVVTVNPGTVDINVPTGTTYSLVPGTYRNFQAYTKSRIEVQPGVYVFNKFILEPGVNFIAKTSGSQRIEFQVATELKFSDRDTIIFEYGTSIPYSLKFYSNQSSMMFIGNDCILSGHFITPNAELHVYSRTKINGALYGRRVVIEPDASVCKPPLLSDLWHSEWAYSPPFTPSTLDYKAVVPDATSTLNVTPFGQPVQ